MLSITVKSNYTIVILQSFKANSVTKGKDILCMNFNFLRYPFHKQVKLRFYNDQPRSANFSKK